MKHSKQKKDVLIQSNRPFIFLNNQVDADDEMGKLNQIYDKRMHKVRLNFRDKINAKRKMINLLMKLQEKQNKANEIIRRGRDGKLSSDDQEALASLNQSIHNFIQTNNIQGNIEQILQQIISLHKEEKKQLDKIQKQKFDVLKLLESKLNK